MISNKYIEGNWTAGLIEKMNDDFATK